MVLIEVDLEAHVVKGKFFSEGDGVLACLSVKVVVDTKLVVPFLLGHTLKPTAKGAGIDAFIFEGRCDVLFGDTLGELVAVVVTRMIGAVGVALNMRRGVGGADEVGEGEVHIFRGTFGGVFVEPSHVLAANESGPVVSSPSTEVFFQVEQGFVLLKLLVEFTPLVIVAASHVVVREVILPAFITTIALFHHGIDHAVEALLEFPVVGRVPSIIRVHIVLVSVVVIIVGEDVGVVIDRKLSVAEDVTLPHPVLVVILQGFVTPPEIVDETCHPISIRLSLHEISLGRRFVFSIGHIRPLVWVVFLLLMIVTGVIMIIMVVFVIIKKFVAFLISEAIT